ncbi:transcriptional regulator [Malaciobacter molluscorum LMG 25693]|uniref:Transcriptional regulator n=1 Tax=Malaciobacter molluscorum LMG 25693 TaxID=870501 RepID=A0A2G1DGV9_9BACT|nr:helix-turn-helix domain-containing protein [Malaciobacter molluscorum]AXX92293.1 transcriptional regulator, HxlR family [Malaciobacter molluscorum LMG 25693]PHO17721.1 transcriptional regulator [Malaciobacter molluscorum LMG 25693]RXJ93540.1 transcriptional regulator [Malaciobacter molluscorum]
MYYINNKQFNCSISVTLDIFNDRWKLGIIWHLIQEDKRFKDLHEEISDITQKTLTVKLKELEEKNIINREVFPEVPPKVVYSLTPAGKRLKPLLEEMYNWGVEYVKEFGKITEENMCYTEKNRRN